MEKIWEVLIFALFCGIVDYRTRQKGLQNNRLPKLKIITKFYTLYLDIRSVMCIGAEEK